MNTHLPKVSIVMTAYNEDMYIAQAIESIRNQTYSNWELIIVDDYSIDQTSSISQHYVRQDKRISYIRTRYNIGQSRSRNIGVEKSNGQFIAFMDADDDCHPERIARQLSIAMRYPNNLIYTNYLYLKKSKIYNSDLNLPYQLLNAGVWVCPILCGASLLLHREIFNSMKGCNEALQRHDDLDFAIRASLHGYVLRNVPSPLYTIRIHNRSISSIDRCSTYKSIDSLYSEFWNKYLHSVSKRKSLYNLTVQGIKHCTWPKDSCTRFRRKAAAIVNLLAIRFASYGEYKYASVLLKHALLLYKWRIDAAITRLILPTDYSLEITGFNDRYIPRIVLRYKANIVHIL